MSLLLKSNNVHLMHAADTPHTNAYICKALGSSAKELTIEEFVEITAYQSIQSIQLCLITSGKLYLTVVVILIEVNTLWSILDMKVV